MRCYPHHLLMLLLAFGLWPGIAVAQGDAAETPLNSHVKRYGSGWECDRGYLQADGVCTLVEIPPNAFLSSNGRNWECDRGYAQDKRSCVAVKLPAHA